MTYDLQLGALASEAISALLLAEATQDAPAYRAFLEKSAEFCQSVESSSIVSANVSLSGYREAEAFISACMNTPRAKAPGWGRRLEHVRKIQKTIENSLKEDRTPTHQEKMEIARVLYAASSATFA